MSTPLPDPLEPLFNNDQLIARIGQSVVTKIFDDNDDGNPDDAPLDQLAADAASKVRGALGPVYAAAMLVSGPATELRRIALDVAHAMAAIRHPGFIKIDGFMMMKQADADLKQVRLTMANLGTDDAPEPAANNGGDVLSGDPNDPCPKDQFALNGTGFF